MTNQYKCQNCFNWVDYRSTVCEHCLSPMDDGRERTTGSFWVWSVIAVIMLLLLAL